MLAYSTITVKPGQSLIDIALEAYGKVEGVFSLLAINSGLLDAIHAMPEPGTQLLVHAEKPVAAASNFNSVAEVPMPVYPLPGTPSAATAGQLVNNNHEPLSSNDPPQPANANYYRGDDFVYHHVDGRWKRNTIVLF